MNKKAGVTDFFIAYGWAIAIIIAAAMAIFYFGILQKAGLVDTRCEFPKTLICSEEPKALSAKKTIELTLTNNMGYTITGISGYSKGDAHCKTAKSSTEEIADTITTTITLERCELLEGIRFSDEVTIEYKDAEGNKKEIIGLIDGIAE